MEKDISNLESITRQNELLKEQNELLREQNELLRRTGAINQDKQETFVENIDLDEIRDDFLVTSHRKKLWNVQIGMINEVARICKKYNIRWFAIGGTLLGAARHKGYIPWDDDVDLAMLRPEYERFSKIALSEIKSPYLLDFWYNYRMENDEPATQTKSLPLISLDHMKKYPLHFPFFPLIKIKDARTFFVEFPDNKIIKQNIWVDIFPLDSLPPFAEERQKFNFEIARLYYIVATHPELIKDAMQQGKHLLIEYGTLRRFMNLPYKERCLYVEEILTKNFLMSEHVGDFRDWCICQGFKFYQTKDFADVIYLPFEKIEVPAPIDYESVLRDFYGDWRTPIITPSHASIYSADISWERCLQSTAAK